MSASPWFLTIEPSSKDVLIWKNGVRLKLRDQESAGKVTHAKAMADGTVTVSVTSSME